MGGIEPISRMNRTRRKWRRNKILSSSWIILISTIHFLSLGLFVLSAEHPAEAARVGVTTTSTSTRMCSSLESIFRTKCLYECEHSLLALPPRGTPFGDCDWECRVQECRYACEQMDYSLGGNANENCLQLCASTNRSAACNSGCIAANMQMTNYVSNIAHSARLLKAQARSWDKIEVTWQVEDSCLESGVVWRAQVRRLAADEGTPTGAPSSEGWMVAPGSIGISGATILDAVVDGGAVKAKSRHRIRLAAYLGSSLIAFSQSLASVTTPSAGLPPDKPVIAVLDALPGLSNNKRIVCWNQSDESVDVSNYTVTITSSAGSNSPTSSRFEVINSTCTVLRSMVVGSSEKVDVVAQNDFGTSPLAEAVVVEAPAAGDREHTVSTTQLRSKAIFYSSRYRIIVSSDKDDYLLSKQWTLYQTRDGEEIVAITAVMNSKIYAALSNGDIVELDASGDSGPPQTPVGPKVAFHQDGYTHLITAMSVDWSNGDVYLAAGRQIVFCAEKSGNCSALVTKSAAITEISDLVVEPRLGYLYYTTSTGLFSLPLMTAIKPVQLLDFRRAFNNSRPNNSPASLALDGQQNFLLRISINSSMYTFDLVSHSFTETRGTTIIQPQHRRTAGDQRDYSYVTKLAAYDGRYYWISHPCSEDSSGYCIYGEEHTTSISEDSRDIQIQRYVTEPGQGRLVGLAIEMDSFIPFISPAEFVSGLYSDEAIRVIWGPPEPLPFQAARLTIPFEYMVSLRLDGQLVASSRINDSSSTNFTFTFNQQHVLPLKLYVIGVRTCWTAQQENMCSAETISWGQTMAKGDLLKTVDILVSNSNKRSVQALDMLANPAAPSYGSAPTSSVVKKLQSLSAYGDYLALDEENCLFTIDSSKKWTSTQFPPCSSGSRTNSSSNSKTSMTNESVEVTCFRYEPLGKYVYYCNSEGIYRIRLGSSADPESISGDGGARSLSLLSSLALALVQRTDVLYGIDLTGAYYIEYFACTSSNDCEILASCTSEGVVAQDYRVYFLVAFYAFPKMELWSTTHDNREPKLLGQSNNTLSVRSMEHYFGKFMFLLEDGRLAVAESNLQAFSYFPLEDQAEAFTFFVPGSSQEALPSVASPMENVNVTATSSGQMLFTWLSSGPSASRSVSPLEQLLHRAYYNITITSVKEEKNRRNGNKKEEDLVYFQAVLDKSYLETDSVPADETIGVSIVAFDYWQSSPRMLSGGKVHQLKTPSAPPSTPKKPRLHVDHVKRPGGLLARVTFLWDEPRWNNGGQSDHYYNVTCWKSQRKTIYLVEMTEKQKRKQHRDDLNQQQQNKEMLAEAEMVDPKQQYFVMDGLPLGVVVSCQVSAATASKIGRPTDIVDADTSVRDPSSILLISTKNGLLLLDAISDVVIGRGPSDETNFLAASSLQGDIIAIREDNRVAIITNGSLLDVENIDIGFNASNKISSLTVDYIGRYLYLAATADQRNSFADGSSVWKYNLDTLEKMQRIYGVSSGVVIERMAMDPFRNVLYFTTYDGREHHLQRLKLSNMEMDIIGPAACQPVSPALCISGGTGLGGGGDGKNFTLQGPEAASAVYVVSENGIVDAETCQPLINSSQNITWHSVGDLIVMEDFVVLRLKNQLIRINRKNGLAMELKGFDNSLVLNGVQAYSAEQQPLPDSACLRAPLEQNTDFRIYPLNKTSARIEFDQSTAVVFDEPDTNCPEQMSLPKSRYVVRVCEMRANTTEHVDGDCQQYETYSNTLRIPNLSSQLQYDVHVSKANFYISNNISSSSSSQNDTNHSQTFNTSQIAHSAPVKLRARTVAPDKVLLTWLRPEIPSIQQGDAPLKYKITVLTPSKVKLHEEEDIECPPDSDNNHNDNNNCHYLAVNLRSNTTHVFRVGPSGDKRPSGIQISDNEAEADTFPKPGTLLAIGSNFTYDSLFLLWQPFKDDHVQKWAIQYTRVAEESWRDVNIDQEKAITNNGIFAFRLSKLRPLTQYKVRLLVFYDSGYNYTEEYTYITNGTVPDAPMNLRIEEKPPRSGKRYFVWDEPFEGGSAIVKYEVEYRDNANAAWLPLANNIGASVTETPLYSTVKPTQSTEFRLRAVNNEGPGKWATTKLNAPAGGTGVAKNVIAIIVGVSVVVLLILIAAVVLFACRRRICGGAGRTGESRKHAFGAQLPGYQGRDGSSHLDALAQISKDDLDALPHVSRNCITASRPLGQGAFGEVYEGLACNLPRIGPKSVRVAIKTLKEGSADVERVKFLKEAILMSKFRHPNIVQLLGVCLESEPHWIILELMEGGDLLTYLRVSRPSETMPSQVTVEDLLSLAIDVSRGCSHLEQHHHVHRDLAARNCLVSSRDPAQRVVKIADFGMARDVYEGDYYRVEGHGLLPVRWMAPESMIDGVFTTKTDVWSFGVLLWEIMTLGQQPYPGRTNWDVMNYVRIGGRLKAPEFCPNELYEIMNSCWAFETAHRPNFPDMTRQLEALRSLPQFQSDVPFPPFYPRSSLSTDSKDNSAAHQAPAAASAGSPTPPPAASAAQKPVDLFVTQASARFQRNTKQGQSQPSKGHHKLQKAAELLSFRKQKETEPAKPPPSKAEIDAGRSASAPAIGATTPETRPTSGESFTTSTEGYEVPLLKNLGATAGGFVNRGYEPTTPSGSMYALGASGASGPSVVTVEHHGQEKKHISPGFPSTTSTSSPRNIYTSAAASPSAGSRVGSAPSLPAAAAAGGKTGTGSSVKPKAPKPPLKPEVVHSSPIPTPRSRNGSPPSSYENVPLD